MKPKYLQIIAIVLMALGASIVLMGALFKLQHWNGASQMLIAGMIFGVVGILALIYNNISQSKSKALK